MSAARQMLMASRSKIIVTSSARTGSGSFTIPAGVTSVSILGQGGAGTDGTPDTRVARFYTQAMTAPNGYVYSDAAFTVQDTGFLYWGGIINPVTFDTAPGSLAYPTNIGTVCERGGETYGQFEHLGYNGVRHLFRSSRTDFPRLYFEFLFSSYISGSEGTPGTQGANSSVSSAAQSKSVVFAGSFSSSYPSQYTQVITGLSGAADTLTYTAAPGTSIQYQYTY